MIIKPDKEKLLEEFIKKYVNEKWVNDFIKADEEYLKDKKQIEESIASKFNLLCQNCIELQNNDLKGEINYIYFSFLRTSILEGRGEVRVDFYDDKWFLDKEECSINIGLNFMYTFLFKLKENLLEVKKQYGRNITDMDVEKIILDESEKYNILASEFIKSIIGIFLETQYYKEMKKSNNIKFLAGEFMDKTEIIYESK